MPGRLRRPRILSWNILDPDAGFLYTVSPEDESAKLTYLNDFMKFLTSIGVRLPSEDELRFVAKPVSGCLRAERSDNGWEPKWVTTSHLTQSDLDDCTLYAIKTRSDGWLMQDRTLEQDCRRFDSGDIEVAVFLGAYCKHATNPSAKSRYSKTRMDLIQTFILTALAESKKPNCRLNLNADILCLQEVPVELHKFLQEALEGKVYIYFSVDRSLLTLVKKDLMDLQGKVHSGNFHKLKAASIVAFKLSEPYQELMDCEWMTVVNYHGLGGASSIESWETLAEGIQCYGFAGCSVVAGDFNLNIPRDVYGWHLSFSSLLQGPKPIDYIGLFGKDRTKWRLSDVQGDLHTKKCIQLLRRKIIPMLETNSRLLDTRQLKDFAAEDIYPGHVLEPSAVRDDVSSAEFNWRALSDHGPILAEITLQDSRERSQEWAHWTKTDSNSTIYHLFRFFRMSLPESPMSPAEGSDLEPEGSNSQPEGSNSESETSSESEITTSFQRLRTT